MYRNLRKVNLNIVTAQQQPQPQQQNNHNCSWVEQSNRWEYHPPPTHQELKTT